MTCGAGGNCGAALQTALTGGGTVYACPGRYTGNFQLTSSVALIGAGDGEDPATATILDANGAGRPLGIFQRVNAALHSVRITGGNPGNQAAGGIFNTGNLTMTACTVRKNTATEGAGIAHSASTGGITLNSCRIADNFGTKQDAIGGGILFFDEVFTLTLNDTIVSGNRVPAGGGGGLALFGKLEARRTTFSGNLAVNGGGIGIGEGAATFDSACVIEDNMASGDGGGIFINKGMLKLNGATVQNNVPNNCVGPGC